MTRFPDGLDVNADEKNNIEGESGVLGSSEQVDDGAIKLDGENWRRNRSGENHKFCFGPVRLESVTQEMQKSANEKKSLFTILRIALQEAPV